jgi:tRNA-Thr(GGU) m(6)t(6)A37 methyltransferase TsaA
MVKRPGRFLRKKYTLADDYSHTITPIGVVHSPYQWREEAPRQANVGDGVEAIIVLRPGLQNTLQDLIGFERIWVIFGFCYSNGWKHQIVPPRDTVKRGILSTRSPDRPNALGMSCVQLIEISGPRITIKECDMLNGSPVYDIKPYIAAYDAFPHARAGWVDQLSKPGPDHRYRPGLDPAERKKADESKE